MQADQHDIIHASGSGTAGPARHGRRAAGDDAQLGRQGARRRARWRPPAPPGSRRRIASSRVVGERRRQLTACALICGNWAVLRASEAHQAQAGQDHPAEEVAVRRDARRRWSRCRRWPPPAPCPAPARARAERGGEAVAAQLRRIAVAVAQPGQLRHGRANHSRRGDTGSRARQRARAWRRRPRSRRSRATTAWPAQAARQARPAPHACTAPCAIHSPGAAPSCGEGPFDPGVACVDQQQHRRVLRP